tara:strand:+ start:2294 stop:2611 length:318 start_codon:yes stop_codon:yes gene_type:complete
MKERLPIENENNFAESEVEETESVADLFRGAYEELEHAPRAGSDVGFNEMMQLPLPVVDLFAQGVIPPHLGEKYLSHKLSEEEMGELTELVEKYIENENLEAEAA